jgi:hypothetical protein
MESTLTSGPVNTLGRDFQGGVILTGMSAIRRPRGLSCDLSLIPTVPGGLSGPDSREVDNSPVHRLRPALGVSGKRLRTDRPPGSNAELTVNLPPGKLCRRIPTGMGEASRNRGRTSLSVAHDAHRERDLDGHLAETVERDRMRASLGQAWCLNQRQSPDEPGEAPLAMAGIPQLPPVVSRTPRPGPVHGLVPSSELS